MEFNFDKILNLVKKVQEELSPIHSLAVLVIVLGLVLAIFVEGAAFTLIGISISVLGAIGLFMLMSQGRGLPGAKKTTQSPRGAQSEGIVKSFGKDASYKPEIEMPKENVRKDDYPDSFEGTDDGFQVVGKDAKSKKTDTKKSEPESLPRKPKEPIRFEDSYAGADDDGFRIVPKGEEARPDEDVPAKVPNDRKSRIINELKNKAESYQRDTKPDARSFSDGDEGFRVVQKGKKAPPKRQKSIRQENTLFSDDDFDYADDFSGMRIIGKAPEKNATLSEKSEQGDDEIHQNIKKSKNQRKKRGQQKKKEILQKSREFKKKRQEGAEDTQYATKDANTTEKLTIPDLKTLENQKYSAKNPVDAGLDINDTNLESREGYSKKRFEEPLSMLMDQEPPTSEEPRKEFHYFLTKVLKVVRTVIDAKTAAFILYNGDSKEMIIEAFDSDTPGRIIKEGKFNIGSDVFSQIIESEKPEILTDINEKAERELLPYYSSMAHTSSFIGIPVFYKKAIIGALCADSNKTDEYAAKELELLGNFSKLIAAIVKSYTEKYDLMQASRTLDAISLFRKIISDKQFTIDDIHESVLKTAAEIFEKPTIGICGYDEETGGWTVKAIEHRRIKNSKIQPGSSVLIENSLIGKAIFSCSAVYKSPLKEEDVRLNKDEPKLQGGYFLAVPLKSFSNNYGSLFLEADKTLNITAYDIDILETLGEHAGSSIEQMLFIEMLQSSSLVDNATGLLNPPAFFGRLDEELKRSSDSDLKFTLCLFKIDKYASLDPDEHSERTEAVLYHVINIIAKHIKPYDVFGNIDSNTFGIIFINSNSGESQLRAEKIRSEIASSVIEIQSQRFNVTISIGLAVSEKGDKVETIVDNAMRVLDMSFAKSNSIHCYG